ncbi:PREDICTED: centromere protein P-like [Colobus angolensis palliatus]|uniref:centromere protein P-like n=1 Tax=Colobus angolensis palliatus TaxID=336983 RepID=UPI0005F5465F|nr:PREDICTED: centromere protein P-like [Colobus angolensis palliatus]
MWQRCAPCKLRSRPCGERVRTHRRPGKRSPESSIRKVLQRHRLSGNCHMVTFQLEFQILEIQRIIYSYRAEERKDLFMFFRSLHFFVEWFEYRKRTFKHFKVKSEVF